MHPRKMAAIGVACALTAAAAPAPAAPTLLHISATGSVPATPDLLVADLLAQATDASAAAAQRRVNTMMAAGMQAARGAAGIDARAIGYSVGPAGEKHPAWTAQQTLELRGSDGPSLLDLAGRLQQAGLAASSLDWQLSPGLRERAHDQATRAALRTMQARAASVATTLGLRVDHIREVRLEAPLYQPRAGAMMAMQARAAPAPQASAAPQEVTAELSADIVLLP